MNTAPHGHLRRRDWLAGATAAVLAGQGRGHAEEPPLRDATVELTVLGIAESAASGLVREMAPGFATHAKDTYGYDVTLRYDDAPRATLYDKATASLAVPSAAPNLIIADSQWLGAFAAEKRIRPLNRIVQANKELDVDWYDPVVRTAYQLYPDGSTNRWGMPQSGDVLALFVRRDWLTADGEAEAFRARFATDLPQRWEDFERLDWDGFRQVLEFFDRPDHGYRGFASTMSGADDGFSCLAVSFLLGRGGRLWEPSSGQVEDVLNTEDNAKALAEYLGLLRFQPEEARGADAGVVAQAFAAGKVFAALHWVSAAPAMLPPGLADAVVVVPPPGFRNAEGELARRYVIGGQVWLLNDGNDAVHTQVATDFLKWWYRPETALDFARRGGLPCDQESLENAEFDAIKPWLRTYKYMLRHASDFWHDPKYVELMAVQQAAFATYAAGSVSDPKLVLDVVACRQQLILFREGSAERRPQEGCRPLLP